MTWSGSMISMSWPVSIMPAVTSPGPLTLRYMRLGPSPCMRSASDLMLRTMSVTSSRTPGMDENSCSTPSIWTRGDRRALQRRQQHAAQRVAERQAEAALERLGDDASPRGPGRRPGSTSSLGGLISSCQFFWITGYLASCQASASSSTPLPARAGCADGGSRAAARRRCRLRRAGACADGSRCAGSASRRGSR